MKLLPIIPYNNAKIENNIAVSRPVFTAKTRIKQENVKKTAKEIFDSINIEKPSGELGEKIKTILANPQSKNIFFTALASLVTAAATQIAGLVSISEKADKSENKNSCLNSPIQKLTKHKGRQADFEINLAKQIEQAAGCFNLADNETAEMINIYNKFCGLNYKGNHYSLDNNLVSNKEITEKYIEAVSKCKNKDELMDITRKYNSEYSLEKYPDSYETDEIIKNIEASDNTTFSILKPYKNLQNSYIQYVKAGDINNEQEVIKEFIQNITNNSSDEEVKKMLLPKINKFYGGLLFEIASIYQEAYKNSPEEASGFSKRIINKMINTEALETWASSGCKQRLDFNTYNSLFSNGVEYNKVKEFAKLKRDTKFNEFKIVSPEHFSVKFPYAAFSRNFHLMNSIFNLIHNADYSPLCADDCSEYTVNDIQAELKKHSSTYPNLKKHLAVKDKSYLNLKKMQGLIDLYYRHENNKNIFTLHSYLRFLERAVLPDIIENGEEEDIYSGKILTQEFIKKLNELKQALNDVFKYPTDIQTYQFENILAPQFIVKLDSAEQDQFVITLDINDKIHTLY